MIPTRKAPRKDRKRYPINELMRLAFIYAEQDRGSLAGCYTEGAPERDEAINLYEQLKAYRLKRWGRTLGDKLDEIKTSVSFEELRKQSTTIPTP